MNLYDEFCDRILQELQMHQDYTTEIDTEGRRVVAKNWVYLPDEKRWEFIQPARADGGTETDDGSNPPVEDDQPPKRRIADDSDAWGEWTPPT